MGRAAHSGKPSECVSLKPSVQSAVPFSTMLVELAEKMGLLAAAALLVVLVPPLRARLLGTGPVRGRRTAAALFGLLLSIWGAMLGLEVSGEHFNVRAIGVLLAAFLGGPLAGLAAGLGAGISSQRSPTRTARSGNATPLVLARAAAPQLGVAARWRASRYSK